MFSLTTILFLGCNGESKSTDTGETKVDDEGDGVFADIDCDDSNPNVSSLETFYQDNDGDGLLIPDELDLDGDGYILGQFIQSVWVGLANIIGGEDHDDLNSNSYPGAPELIDGVDNDGNGNLLHAEQDFDGDNYV